MHLPYSEITFILYALLALTSTVDARANARSRRRSRSLIQRAQDNNLYPISPISSYSADPLTDGSLAKLNPTNRNAQISFVTVPGDGSTAIEASYPQGSYTLTHGGGGFSFYLVPEADTIDFSNAREVTFTYSVYFEAGFDWNKGGKLPGIFGGNSIDTGLSCSGGRQDNRDACFSVRVMWREKAAGEFYVYLPQGKSKEYCQEEGDHCNKDFGDSLGRGSFAFAAGQWTTITQRVRLNSIGQQDGEAELWVNGRSVLTQAGLVFRTSGQAKVLGLMMQTFFGGGSADYASPKAQKAYFKDWAVAVTQQF